MIVILDSILANNTSVLTEAIIQGSNNTTDWDNLHTITKAITTRTEIALENTGYYQYYRILVNSSEISYTKISEWQTSEYIVKEQIPSTEHNEQVKIGSNPVEVIRERILTGDIIPKTWASGANSTSTTQLIAANGITVTASGYHKGWPLYQAFDGDDNTYNAISATSAWICIDFTKPEKILKMNCSVHGTSELTSVIMEGSKNGSDWTVLHKRQGSLSGILDPIMILDNADFYQYYRISGTMTGTVYGFCINEWETLEYVETYTEVV